MWENLKQIANVQNYFYNIWLYLSRKNKKEPLYFVIFNFCPSANQQRKTCNSKKCGMLGNVFERWKNDGEKVTMLGLGTF
jgi:hypothetical protein